MVFWLLGLPPLYRERVVTSGSFMIEDYGHGLPLAVPESVSEEIYRRLPDRPNRASGTERMDESS